MREKKLERIAKARDAVVSDSSFIKQCGEGEGVYYVVVMGILTKKMMKKIRKMNGKSRKK